MELWKHFPTYVSFWLSKAEDLKSNALNAKYFLLHHLRYYCVIQFCKTFIILYSKLKAPNLGYTCIQSMLNDFLEPSKTSSSPNNTSLYTATMNHFPNTSLSKSFKTQEANPWIINLFKSTKHII